MLTLYEISNTLVSIFSPLSHSIPPESSRFTDEKMCVEKSNKMPELKILLSGKALVFYLRNTDSEVDIFHHHFFLFVFF